MKFRITLLAFIVLSSSCQKEDFDIINLNNNYISVFGHAGLGTGQKYPINSLESILACLNYGADGTELDVQMTKDSVLVAYHAVLLEDASNMSGSIIDKKWCEINGAIYNYPIYSSYKLISLDELFSNISNIIDYTFTFDCHINNSNNDLNSYYLCFANAIDKITSKYNLQNNLFIESHNVEFLAELQNNKRDYKLFIIKSPFELGFEIASNMSLFGITIPNEDVTYDQIDKAHRNNLFVTIWNTRIKTTNIEAVNKNPDFIQTDKIQYLIKLLEE